MLAVAVVAGGGGRSEHTRRHVVDGELEQHEGRWRLRFTRRLAHPVERVWAAITEREGLAAWFPFTIDGERRTGAPLRFASWTDPSDTAEAFEGELLAYDPPRVFAIRWGGDEELRLELRPDGDGCVLEFVNDFPDQGKAARDAAGWHECLDRLGHHLAGTPVPFGQGERWGEVHPGYVAAFGPAAATIGPPGRA
jgi:uncharacterized protein YndB with AHSA1/START domain